MYDTLEITAETCPNLIGTWVEDGEYPADIETLGAHADPYS